MTKNYLVISQFLILAGSFIFIILGSIHLMFTFFGTEFRPFDPKVEDAMRGTSPRITKETSMWNAWIGFNGSHSIGAIFFGLVNLILVTSYFTMMKESVGLQFLMASFVLFYLFLASKYWFRIPLMGILVSCICFIGAFVLFHIP